jgi:riboflavin transporter
MTKNKLPVYSAGQNDGTGPAGIETMKRNRKMSTRKLTSLALLAALAAILMFLETAIPFMPPFLKLDISEIPVLLGAFAFGPGSAVIIELIKNLIHLPFTQTAGVGELANFLAGSMFAGTAGAVYHFMKNKKGAIIAMAAGTVAMTIFSSLFNYFFMLDFYSKFYGMPMDAIVGMSAAVNIYVKDVKTLIVYAFIPFNLFKGIVAATITAIIYKRVSPFLHGKKRLKSTPTAAETPNH